MNSPRLFHDEIAARLRDLHHCDKVIIHSGGQEIVWTRRETMINEDGIVSPFHRFEDKKGMVVACINDKLYNYSENGDDLYVVINGILQPF